jgi:gas vesicle protein
MGKANTVKKLALGAAVAGAAGYVVGILTAPAEGKKTRAQLKHTAESGVSDIEKQLKQLHSELGDLVDNAKDGVSELNGRTQKKFSSAIDGAKDAKDKLRDILSMVHEGEATDKELKKALQDARHSIDHLKQYLKK